MALFILLGALSLPVELHAQPGIYADTHEPRMTEVELRNLSKLKGIGFLEDLEGASLTAGKKSFFIDPAAQPVNINQNYRTAFRKKTGLLLEEEESQGARMNLGFQGTSPAYSEQVAVMLDGFPLNADFSGLRQVFYVPDINSVSQIQFVQGGSSVLYGAPPGGAVNFIGYQPPGDQPVRASATFTVGSDDFFESFTQAGGTVDGIGWSAFGKYATGSGYNTGSDFDRASAGFRIILPVGEAATLSMQYIYADYDLRGFTTDYQIGVPGMGLTSDEYAANPTQSGSATGGVPSRQEVERHIAMLLYTRDFNGQGESLSRVEWRTWYSDTDQHISVNTRGTGSSSDLFTEQTSDTRIIYPGTELRWLRGYDLCGGSSTGHFFTAGMRLQGSQTTINAGLDDLSLFQNAAGLFPGSPVRDFTAMEFSAALFAENKFQITERWNVTPGVRLEYLRQQADGTDFTVNSTVLKGEPIRRIQEDVVPLFSLATEYDLAVGFSSFTRPATLYANASRSMQPLTYVEALQRRGDVHVPNDLRQPASWHGELGVRGNPTSWFTYDVSGFWRRSEDLISAPSNDNVGVPGANDAPPAFNTATTQTFGGEFFAQVDLFGVSDALCGEKDGTGMSQYGHLNLFSAITLQHGTVEDAFQLNAAGTPIDSGRDTPYTPGFMAKFGLEYNYQNRWKAAFSGTHVSSQFGDNWRSTQRLSFSEIPA
ncbi:MAG TPA: TonB-dependent receptor, partial [Candidatus Methylacidiphilales bacterium]|nr:TonB-dependent receptor [Candidatus Methylacidiphilales bacterium]